MGAYGGAIGPEHSEMYEEVVDMGRFDIVKGTLGQRQFLVRSSTARRTLDVLLEHVTRSRPDTEGVRHVVGTGLLVLVILR